MGKVIWLTGLSGAGKSTLAQAVHEHLHQHGWQTRVLDGDELRSLTPSVGFSKEDRDAHVVEAGKLAAQLAGQGLIVICALISPYREVRETARRMCDHFIEVYVKCPIDVCEQRDPKGLYKKARAGEITQFTGIDDPYEEPDRPEIILETDTMGIRLCVDVMIEELLSPE